MGRIVMFRKIAAVLVGLVLIVCSTGAECVSDGNSDCEFICDID
jgi:hypothetical protein